MSIEGLSEKELKEIVERDKKRREREKRVWVKNLLYVQKAKQQNIVVSESEIDEYIKKNKSN